MIFFSGPRSLLYYLNIFPEIASIIEYFFGIKNFEKKQKKLKKTLIWWKLSSNY